MKDKIKNIIPFIYIIAFLIFLLGASFALIYGQMSPYNYSNVITYFGLIGFVIYIINKIISKNKISFYDILIFLLIIFGTLSYFFALDRHIALYGFLGRYEGLHMIITYYVVFLLCKDIIIKKHKEIIVNMIIFIGVVNLVYGILQFTGISTFLNYNIIRNGWYATGLVSNANFFGTIMIMNFALTLGLYISKTRTVANTYYGFLSFLFYIGILISGTMSAILTFVLLLIITFILLIRFKPKLKEILFKALVMLVFIITGYFIFNHYDNGSLMKEVDKTAGEITDVTKGSVKTSFGTGRLYIWKETLKRFPKYILTGAGIDNFYYAFGEKPLIDPVNGLYLDKAHNEYIQKGFTEGILSVTCYLILLLTIFIKAFKKIWLEKNIKNYLLFSLFLGFTCYSIQAFFNISITRIAPMYYMIMGLLLQESYIVITKKKDKKNIIPKVVNYVWVGDKAKSKKEKRCIKTWQKYLEDYEIVEWNENNFDINSHPYLKKAYKQKKWAHVSDYIRAYVIYQNGGIYLDTDIMLFKNLDDYLNDKCFLGFENKKLVMTSLFGAVKGHPIIKDMLDHFENNNDFNTPNTIWFTKILTEKYKLKINNKMQKISNETIIYPKENFSEPNKNNVSLHIFEGSWVENKNLSSKIATFFRRYSNIWLVRQIYTKIILKIKNYK